MKARPRTVTVRLSVDDARLLLHALAVLAAMHEVPPRPGMAELALRLEAAAHTP